MLRAARVAAWRLGAVGMVRRSVRNEAVKRGIKILDKREEVCK
jgi:hypothetical protein